MYLTLIDTDLRYFAVPRYFFRGTFTSSTCNVPMAYVQWIPFTLDTQNRTTSHGRISLTVWNEWPERSPITLNPFISTVSLSPSRFALAFIPPTAGTIFVDVAFIALDAENLCEESADQFTHDFGDNKFSFYKGNNSIRLTEELIDDDNPINHESDNQVQQCFLLKEYIPPSVLRFLLLRNPIRLV